MQRSSNELKDTTYGLFIGGLSVLSIINLLLFYLIDNLIVSGVVVIVDGLLSLIFLTDFLFRLFNANSKTHYFFVQFGWADLLASLPFPQVKKTTGLKPFPARVGSSSFACMLHSNRGSIRPGDPVILSRWDDESRWAFGW